MLHNFGHKCKAVADFFSIILGSNQLLWMINTIIQNNYKLKTDSYFKYGKIIRFRIRVQIN